MQAICESLQPPMPLSKPKLEQLTNFTFALQKLTNEIEIAVRYMNIFIRVYVYCLYVNDIIYSAIDSYIWKESIRSLNKMTEIYTKNEVSFCYHYRYSEFDQSSLQMCFNLSGILTTQLERGLI